MFGHYEFESSNPFDHGAAGCSHPAVRQWWADFEHVRKHDDHCWIWEAIQNNPIKLFHDPNIAKQFCNIDFAYLKARDFSVSIPPPGWAPPHTATCLQKTDEQVAFSAKQF
jgi:hypothetical protein